MSNGKQGKLWGATELLIRNSHTEVHRINGKPDKQCSIHLHRYKHNMFYVVHGDMQIEIFQENGLIDTTFISDGEWMVVPPNVKHRMGFLSETLALEIYWPEGIEENDIERDTIGGDIGTDD